MLAKSMRFIRPVFRMTAVFLLAAILALQLLPVPAEAVVVPTWTQTSQAEFALGVTGQTDYNASPGDVVLARVGSGYVYAFQGNGSNKFWRYDVASGMWSELTPAPYAVGAGGALVYDGNNYIYALMGNNTKYFERYNIANNTWEDLIQLSSRVNAGGALAYAGGDVVYIFRGQSGSFYRYSISGNSWIGSTTSAPATVYGGAALAWGGGNYIYALKGGNYNYFWRYSISGNSWEWKTGPPEGVGDGGSLAWDGGSYLYALKGNNTVLFWRYTIATDTWTTMADTPATPCVYGGGALTYDGNGHCYALRGNSKTDFWKYNVATNIWDTSNNTPAEVAYGGALVSRLAPYYTTGTFTSTAYDTGYSADFQYISWNGATPAGTTLKFQIAANNDNATWNFTGPDGSTGTWYTASNTAIYSGQDGNRYVKYRAFFTTADIRYTPSLNDITISYIRAITAPVVVTGAADAVEEDTATLHGTVTDDGGEVCQYRFTYGTSPGVYSANTTWTSSLTSGGTFSETISGLSPGTRYYYRAQAKNSVGEGSGGELDLLTKPEAPTSFMASTIDGVQIQLDWSKGPGAGRTRIVRQTGDYPANPDDGTMVYFDNGTTVIDSGLTPGVTYFYRAWSEVAAGSWQQWSDEYRSVTIATETSPSSVTDPPDMVEETSATFYGSVIFDMGEACEYRFVYGTEPGGPYPFSTPWTGSVTSGQSFSAVITGLGQGTKYYYVAEVRNSYGTISDGETHFLTKPEKPEDPVAAVEEVNATQIVLTWTKGVGAQRTMIRRKVGSYPVDRSDGIQVYYDTGTTWTDTGLDPDTVYYYRFWSQVSGSEQWSDDYSDMTVETSTLAPPPTTTPPPTTPPPTSTPISVGGKVYKVDKMQLVEPWMAGITCLLAIAACVVLNRAASIKRK